MTKKYCKPFRRGVSWRSQEFGTNPNNGTNGAGGHTGNDEAATSGSTVYAAGDGVIDYAGTFDDSYADNLLWLLDFGGNIMVLDCGDTEPTFVYAHLSKFLVSAGTRVVKGQPIALSGNSGTRTTGDHLHMEAIAPGFTLNSPTLGRVDPDTYLTEWPEDLVTVQTSSTGVGEEMTDDEKEMRDNIRKLVKQQATMIEMLTNIAKTITAIKDSVTELVGNVRKLVRRVIDGK